jgi:hypothetical protein
MRGAAEAVMLAARPLAGGPMMRVTLAVLTLALAATPAAAQHAARWQGVAGGWTVSGPDGQWLGQIDLATGAGIAGEGSLGPGAAGVFLQGVIHGTEALVLQVHHGIGDTAPGQLLLSEDGAGGLQGTYVRAESWQLVRLTRSGAAPAPVPPDEDFGDLPGVGVSGPPYRLRNVPADGWVRVHRWARVTSAQFDQRLWRDTADILVLGCDPQTDAAAVEAADAAARLRMMDALWCRIEAVDAGGIVTEGWVAGRHLEPMWDRIGGRP